jgi:hypothetical protein
MAHIDSCCTKAIEFAKTINPDIKIDNGINWIWAYGFKSYEDADKFDQYCTSNGCETRGVYTNQDKTADVRFR